MADLSELQSSLSVKIAGAGPSTGVETNWMSVDANGTAQSGLYNTSGTSIDFNYGFVGDATMRVASQIGNATGAADFNYGTVGAQTLRIASQIGNATGAADFNSGNSSAQTLRVVVATNQSALPVSQSGTWATGRTWTLASGTDSISSVQSGNWSVRLQDGSGTALTSTLLGSKQSLDVNIANGLDVGTADKTTFTYGTSIFQPVGGVFQDTSPTLTAGQSGSVRLTTNRAFHVNLRDANGNEKLNQQTMVNSIPVVLASDQSAIPVSQSGSWTTGRTWTLASGTDSVSVVQSTSPWITKDQSNGPVAAGSVASFSQLIGGQYNSTLPTLTTGQQAAMQVDSSGRLLVSVVQSSFSVTQGTSPWIVSGTISTSNFPSAVDTNYGTVGVNTIRGAAQIGNATGAADFNSGNSSAQTLRVVIATNQSAIPVSQSGSWTVASTQSGTWTTGRTWTLASGTDSVSAVQSGTWNIGTLTSITNPVAVTQSGSWTVAVTQTTSPWVVKDQADGPVAPGTAASFSMLTGGVYNSAGITLTNGQQSSLQLTSTGALLVSGTISATNPSVGSVAATPPTSATYIGGSVTTSPPTYTTGQMDPLSLTTTGLLRVDGSNVTQPVSGTVAVIQSTSPWVTNISQFGGAAVSLGQKISTSSIPVVLASDQSAVPATITQTEKVSTNNSSITNLAASGVFTGVFDSLLGYEGVEVNFKADQNVTIQVEQSIDSTNWDIIDSYVVFANTGDSRTFKANSSYIRVLVTNNGASTTTIFRLQTILTPITNVLPRSLTANGELKNADVCNVSSVFGSLSVTTTASEAKIGTLPLTGRKYLFLQPQNGNVYYGFSNAVTTSTGIALFKNQTIIVPIGDNVHLWLISTAGTVIVNATELS